MNDLNLIYKNLLEFAGLVVDDDKIYIEGKDKLIPIKIDNKQLVLPTNANLKNLNLDEYVIFHPLVEKGFQNASPVLNKLRDHINFRLNMSYYSTCVWLLTILNNPAEQTNLSAPQTDILVQIGHADKKCRDNFIEICKYLTKKGFDNYFINIYQKRHGVIKDKKYGRISLVSFQFYNELKNKNLTLDLPKLKLRDSDYEIYMNLYKVIFPLIEDEGYNKGSDNGLAPWFDSLIKTSVELTLAMNDIITLFKDTIKESDNLIIDMSKVSELECIDNLSNLIRKIPFQKGNDGEITSVKPLDNKEIDNRPNIYPNQQIPSIPPRLEPIQEPRHDGMLSLKDIFGNTNVNIMQPQQPQYFGSRAAPSAYDNMLSNRFNIQQNYPSTNIIRL